MTSAAADRSMAAIRGALVGIAATLPMSALMTASVAAGVMPDQPPRRIIGELLPGLPDRAADVVTVVTHALYGGAAGAAYALLPLPRRSSTTGTGFGLLLWAAGYEVWVPLVGALPPAHRDHRGRVATMIAAHLVFGAVLGRSARR
jgi:hypothetical protein